MSAHLPAGLEVTGLVRAAQAAGGFAMVLNKGEPDAGTLLVVITSGGRDSRAWERMPALDGTRAWHCAQRQDPADPLAFESWVQRRIARDPDLWVLELDLADGERLLGI